MHPASRLLTLSEVQHQSDDVAGDGSRWFSIRPVIALSFDTAAGGQWFGRERWDASS